MLLGLTSIGVGRGEVDALLGRARTVGHLHLQLVPRRLLQVVQDIGLRERAALGPRPRVAVHWPVLHDEGGDGAAAVVPAIQVELNPCGVDTGKQLVLLHKLGLCEVGRGVEGETEVGIERKKKRERVIERDYDDEENLQLYLQELIRVTK